MVVDGSGKRQSQLMGVNRERAWNVKWREEKEKSSHGVLVLNGGNGKLRVAKRKKMRNGIERWVGKHESLAMERERERERERFLKKKN